DGAYRRGDAAAQPAPAVRNEHRDHVLEVLEDLEADRSVSGDDRGIADRMDERPFDTGMMVVDQDLPPIVEGNPERLDAEPLDRRDVRVRRMPGYDEVARDSEASRVPRHTLRHVARARGVHAARERLSRKQAHRAPRAAQLERSDRLEVLELEPDLRRCV